MKVLVFMIVCTIFQAQAETTYAQVIFLIEKKATLSEILKKIRVQSGYGIIYNEDLVSAIKNLNVKVEGKTLTQALDIVLADLPLSYSIEENLVVIKRKFGRMNDNRQQVVQDSVITGRVIDAATRKPIPGVTVSGSRSTAQTLEDGTFRVNSQGGSRLTFSYIGYISQTIEIKGRTTINIVLQQEVAQLDEMVIVGYGTTTRRKSTGSISSITADEIAKQPVQNPLNALQGRVAGALVTQSNGLPGSRVTIQIRGQNTISTTDAGNQPLYIIDGVPFMMTDNSVPNNNDLNGRGQFAASGGQSPFNLINPADIERIDILKDADATAIYGARGGNGVVLITTKKGTGGKTKIDVNAYYGQGKVGHFIPMMNTQQYLEMRKEAFKNAGTTPTMGNAPDLLLWDQNAYTDWQRKYIGGTADMADAQTTISGGDQRTTFSLNAGFHRETPVLTGDYKSQRVSSRLNVDHNSLDRKFNANVSFIYSYDNTDLMSQDISTLFNLPPNMPLYNPNGSLYWVNGSLSNPEAALLAKYYGKTQNLMTNALLRYTVLPGLDLKTSFGFNRMSLNQNTQTPLSSINQFSSWATALGNQASFAYIEQSSYILEPQATYTRNIAKGRIIALVGSTFQNSLNTSTSLQGNKYPSIGLLGNINAAAEVTIPTYGYTQYRYTSLFGRLTYDWDSKYLLNAVVRRDGSSRFGAGRRFGNFWSVGAGWVFSNESFAQALPFLSFGKLRASYGLTGNDQIQEYKYRTFFVSAGTYQNNTALRPNNVENPNLHWQTIKKLEFGLDLSFLNRRIDLTVNYYQNKTDDQLGTLNLPGQVGFRSFVSNFDANIRNTGLEFELNTKNIQNRGFSWQTSFNLTVPNTKLLSASPTYFFFTEGAIGQPLSVVRRFTYKGVDPATGAPMYHDTAKDALTFTPNFNTDRSIVGFTAPRFYGGINNTFSYKGVDLSFFFQFTGQDGNILPTGTPGVFGPNLPTLYLDRWTKPGDVSTMPKVTTNTSVYSSWGGSDAVWGDASFLRLRTVNISYTLPRTIINRLKLDNIRVYVSGQNLWWTSKNKYVYDPETGSIPGQSSASMPPLRVITAGLNLTL